MKSKTRVLLVVAALLASTLACNLPFDEAQVFLTNTPAPLNTAIPTVTLTSTQPGNSGMAETPPPTALAAATELSSSTPPSTVTSGPTLTRTSTLIPSLTFTVTSTSRPSGTLTSTVTPPPTITTGPTATRTRTLTPSLTHTVTNTPKPSLTFTVTSTAKPGGTSTNTVTPPPTITSVPASQTLTATATRTGTPVTPGPARQSSEAAFFSTPPVLDGVWDEWQGRSSEYPARAVVYGGANWTGADDLEASYRVAWDSQYLYIAVKVHDDIYAQNATGANLYLGDSLEVLLDTNLAGDLGDRSLSDDDFQLGISPGFGDVTGAREAYLWFPRSRTGAQGGVVTAAVRQDGITRIEAAIPWSVFGVVPAASQRFGFVISVSDNDDTGQNAQQSMVASVSTRVLVDPTTWGEIVLK